MISTNYGTGMELYLLTYITFDLLQQLECCHGPPAISLSRDACRPKYENLIKTLGIRPIKVQAAKGISIRVTARGIQAEAEGDNLPE